MCKLLCFEQILTYFKPIQLDVSVPSRCEVVVHACRRYLEAMPNDHFIAKLDFTNAFNCLHRDDMLETMPKHVPEIYAFCHLSYNSSTMLKFNSHTIISDEGIQQGDPLSPLLFCLAIHRLIQSLSSELVIGYMDDITLGGPIDIVANDVTSLKDKGISFGVHLNTGKCESITKTASVSFAPLTDFLQLDIRNSLLLGAPLSISSAMDTSLQKKII